MISPDKTREHLEERLALAQCQLANLMQCDGVHCKDGCTQECRLKREIRKKEQHSDSTSLINAIHYWQQKEGKAHEYYFQLLDAREAERRLLASELHDAIAQQLVALQLTLKRVQGRLGDTAESQLLLEGSLNACNGLIRDVRQLCQGLYPTELELFGLCHVLKELQEHFRHAGVDVEIKCRGMEKNRRFDNRVELSLFRIAQEAVSNAVRHGHADHVVLDFELNDDVLIMKIINNGRPFKSRRENARGLGLHIMEERARAARGTFSIASERGMTIITVELPRPEDRPETPE